MVGTRTGAFRKSCSPCLRLNRRGRHLKFGLSGGRPAHKGNGSTEHLVLLAPGHSPCTVSGARHLHAFQQYPRPGLGHRAPRYSVKGPARRGNHLHAREVRKLPGAGNRDTADCGSEGHPTVSAEGGTQQHLGRTVGYMQPDRIQRPGAGSCLESVRRLGVATEALVFASVARPLQTTN